MGGKVVLVRKGSVHKKYSVVMYSLFNFFSEDGEPIYSEDAEFKRAADEKNVEKMEQFLVSLCEV